MNKKLLAVLAGATLVGQAQAAFDWHELYRAPWAAFNFCDFKGGTPEKKYTAARLKVQDQGSGNDVANGYELAIVSKGGKFGYMAAKSLMDPTLEFKELAGDVKLDTGSGSTISNAGADDDRRGKLLDPSDTYEADGVKYHIAKQQVQGSTPAKLEWVVAEATDKSSVIIPGQSVKDAALDKSRSTRAGEPMSETIREFRHRVGQWKSNAGAVLALAGTVALIKQGVDLGAAQFNNDEDDDEEDA